MTNVTQQEKHVHNLRLKRKLNQVKVRQLIVPWVINIK